MEKFVALRPEEYERRRAVISASSITQCWREFIAVADATVLRDKRREDAEKFAKWRLRFLDHSHRRGQGPVFEMSQVGSLLSIFIHSLSPLSNLGEDGGNR